MAHRARGVTAQGGSGETGAPGARRRAAPAAHGRGRPRVPLRGRRRQGDAARPLRGTLPARRPPLHVRPRVGDRLPLLRRLPRPGRPPRASAGPEHLVRRRLPGPVHPHPAVQGAHGLGGALVLLGARRLQHRLRGDRVRRRRAGRAAGPELLPARARPGVPHLLGPRRGPGRTGRHHRPPRPDRPRPGPRRKRGTAPPRRVRLLTRKVRFPFPV
ncbi:conserved hypothetical protein [Streptomyces misionensis JCM 4497]